MYQCWKWGSAYLAPPLPRGGAGGLGHQGWRGHQDRHGDGQSQPQGEAALLGAVVDAKSVGHGENSSSESGWSVGRLFYGRARPSGGAFRQVFVLPGLGHSECQESAAGHDDRDSDEDRLESQFVDQPADRWRAKEWDCHGQVESRDVARVFRGGSQFEHVVVDGAESQRREAQQAEDQPEDAAARIGGL